MASFNIPTGSNRRNATSIDALMNDSLKKSLDRIIDATHRASRKLTAKELERRAAIAETIDEWLSFLAEDGDEETLTAFFTQLELLASGKNRKRIAGHPLRPEDVAPLVEKELARREAERDRARQEREAAKPGGETSSEE